MGSNSTVELNFGIMRFHFLMILLYSKDSIQFNKHLMSHYYAKTLHEVLECGKHFAKAPTVTWKDHEFKDHDS